jgi:peptide/nickel transport system substrate-binding protein
MGGVSKRTVEMAALGLLLGLLLASCAPAPAPSAPGQSGTQLQRGQPKRAVVAIRGSAHSLAQERTNPSGGGGSVPGIDGLQALVHAGLVTFDPQDALQPQLGEAVPSLENGLWQVLPDGRMEMTWKIREGARWQDGTFVTAGDFLFAMEVDQDRELGIPRHPIYDLIERVEAPDARTLVAWWKQPYIDADATFSYGIAVPLPRHLLEAAYREDRAGFLGLPYWSREYVGAGPFKVREWVIDSHVMMEANDAYVLGRPAVDEIELRFIPDPNTLFANVLAGVVEVTLGRGMDFQQGTELINQWKGGTVQWYATSWYKSSPQFLDPRPAVVADLRFRRALMHATDREEMAQTFMGGYASIADTPLLPDSPAYQAVESSIVRYPYDPRLAGQMIESLGYTRGGDGVFRDGSGQRLSVELRTTVGLAIQGPITLSLAEYWKRVGVDVETVMIPPQQMQDREYRATYPSFEMVSNGIGLAPKDIGRWHSANTPLPENRFVTTGNDPRYKNAEFDALIDRYVSTIPREPRLQALAGIVRHQTENLNLMGLFYNLNPSIKSNRLQNVTSRAARSNEAWNAHQWDVR